MDPTRPYWNMEIEPLFNTPDIQKIQFEKLKNMLCRLKANAPFYAKMMANSKLDPENLNSLEEFKEKISLFNKESLRELVGECGGNLLARFCQRP